MKSYLEVHRAAPDWIRRYPRTVRSRDGLALEFTPMVASDWQLLESFLRATPENEKKFFRHDMDDSKLVERWCAELDYEHIFPLLLWDHGQIVADGILQREPTLWTAHVGRLRLLVHPQYRRRGVGKLLLEELIDIAAKMRLHKLLHECAAEQADLIGLLRSFGFLEAARLKEFVRDRHGGLHDMVLMVR